MTTKQEELKLKHGDLRQFEAAVLKAYHACMITYDEAIRGIEQYTDEWYRAGKEQ